MRILLAATLLVACSPTAPVVAESLKKDWIPRSNQNAQLLLDVQAKFAPELAARTGVSGIDDRISDFTPGRRQRQRQAVQQAVSELEERQKGERDPNVNEDLAILIEAGRRQIRGSELQESLQVRNRNWPGLISGGVNGCPDPRL